MANETSSTTERASTLSSLQSIAQRNYSQKSALATSSEQDAEKDAEKDAKTDAEEGGVSHRAAPLSSVFAFAAPFLVGCLAGPGATLLLAAAERATPWARSRRPTAPKPRLPLHGLSGQIAPSFKCLGGRDSSRRRSRTRCTRTQTLPRPLSTCSSKRRLPNSRQLASS